jgi:uncharacterized membrane protein HdeD (DUF308 family)
MNLNLILIGAIAMASLVAGLFFLRFWRDTRDGFFRFFAASFFLEAINRAALGLSLDPNEGSPLFYFVRLVSFLLILIAIAQKNRAKKSGSQRLSRKVAAGR